MCWKQAAKWSCPETSLISPQGNSIHGWLESWIPNDKVSSAWAGRRMFWNLVLFWFCEGQFVNWGIYEIKLDCNLWLEERIQIIYVPPVKTWSRHLKLGFLEICGFGDHSGPYTQSLLTPGRMASVLYPVIQPAQIEHQVWGEASGDQAPGRLI